MRTRIVAGVVIASAAVTAPAFAEGSWYSSISSAAPGFSSRTWTDLNTDSASTRVKFTRCTNALSQGTSAEVQLTIEHTFTPDENRGRKTLQCAVDDTGNWGDEPNGNFHFTVTKVGGATSGQRLWVKRVDVWY